MVEVSSSAIVCMKDGIPLGTLSVPISLPPSLFYTFLPPSPPSSLSQRSSPHHKLTPPRLLDLCVSTPSLIITPDYRLLPEANATDILNDVESFWLWLLNTLPTLATTWPAQPDLSRLACAGTSAGGYLAVQSALQFPNIAPIKFLISIAGGLNTDVPYYRAPGPRLILGKRAPPPAQAEAMLRNYVRGIKEGAVRTSGDPVEMWEFLTCVLQQAYLLRWLGIKDDERLDPMKALVEEREMPPVWLIQGQQDSVVCADSFGPCPRLLICCGVCRLSLSALLDSWRSCSGFFRKCRFCSPCVLGIMDSRWRILRRTNGSRRDFVLWGGIGLDDESLCRRIFFILDY